MLTALRAYSSESPFANKEEMRKMYILLHKVFKTVLPYSGPIPTYPGGYWSWAFCTDDNDNSIKDEARAIKIEQNAKLYNRELHKGVFSVPNFVRKLANNE